MNNIILELTEAERNHPLWLRIQAHLEARLKSLMTELCREQTEQQTAIIRGHVK